MSTKELSIIDDLQLWISEREGKIPIEVLYLPRPASDYKDFPPMNENNIETWNQIVYSWLLHGMMKDDRIKYGSAMGRAEVLTNKLFDAIKLQSQHKKLVDAIQLYIDNGNLYDHMKEKLQNLLKESEK